MLVLRGWIPNNNKIVITNARIEAAQPSAAPALDSLKQTALT